jgi:hexosaminidase
MSRIQRIRHFSERALMQNRLHSPAIFALIALSACASHPRTAPSPQPAPISVIPIPVSLSTVDGPAFAITPATVIVADTASIDQRRAVSALLAVLRPSTGYALPIVANTDSSAAAARAPADTNRRTVIRFRVAADNTLGAEGYTLVAGQDSVVIAAPRGAGLFHGAQTLRQLLPFGVESHQSEIRMGPWLVPALSVTDAPRFVWRGAMLDVARHFFTVDEVKQYIDILALYKFNVLHLHLSDDQGWRIEIKSHPELTAMGAASEVGGGPGGFFTQADYADLIRYAADRYVMIVPEIDMPAHINAALISHPELSCGRLPAVYPGINVGFSAICPDSEGTYALLDDVIREIAAMTPAPYLHIGGDEVQVLNAAQYTKFIGRMQTIVRKYGKRMVGWQEIGTTPLDPTTIVQHWQGDSLPVSLPPHTDLILSGASRMYLDMKYTTATELGLHWAGYNDVDVAYNWDPATTFKGLGDARVLGLEAPLWSETVRNITAAEFLTMPRLPAIAEVAWSPQTRRNWDDFRVRVAAHSPRWNLLGVNYYHSTQIPW